MLKAVLFLSLILTPFWAFGQSTPAGDVKPVPENKPQAEAKPAEGQSESRSAADEENNAGAPIDPNTYIIGAEDVLHVRVWREPDLSGQVIVRPDGVISLPLVNEVEAAGQTPKALSKAIAEGLSKYMTHPEVNVAVQQVNSKKYFLQGEVNRPGSYPLLIPTTVLEALVNAGGFQEFANKKKIVVMRGKERFKFNYNDVIKGKHLEQNIQLRPGDLIIVP